MILGGQMKNTIKYFYNIYTKDIIKYDNNYKINDGKTIYYLTLVDTDLNILIKIYKYLIANNIYCHEIILNKDNSMVTTIDNKNYILLKMHIENKKINLQDINNFNILVDNNVCNWYELWTRKLDYYEYQMSQFKIKYPLLYRSFSYYSGLSETAIQLVNNSKIGKVNIYLNHKRIKKSLDSFEFYNPASLILDVKVRDICEYFKMMFFYKDLSINDVILYLDYSNLTNEEAILFLSRMLYPSYYFDLYDLIIQDKKKEDEINFILEKSLAYENLLKQIFLYFYNKYEFPEIEWLTII